MIGNEKRDIYICAYSFVSETMDGVLGRQNLCQMVYLRKISIPFISHAHLKEGLLKSATAATCRTCTNPRNHLLLCGEPIGLLNCTDKYFKWEMNRSYLFCSIRWYVDIQRKCLRSMQLKIGIAAAGPRSIIYMLSNLYVVPKTPNFIIPYSERLDWTRIERNIQKQKREKRALTSINRYDELLIV